MQPTFTRRSLLAAGASMLALGALPQAPARRPRPSCASAPPSPSRICAPTRTSRSPTAIKDGYEFEPYWGNTLFKQGTELVALQRGNLEMAISRRPTSRSRFPRGR